MPPRSIREQLVPPSFHQELVRAMQAAGLTRMYQFTATTDQDTYYSSVRYAQETSHFFYDPDRGFVVQLVLTEHFGTDDWNYSSWSGAVYLQLDNHAMIEYEVFYVCSQHERAQYYEDECEPLGHVMGSVYELLKPFRHRGGSRYMDRDEDGSYGWLFDSSSDASLTVDQLVTFADGLHTHFGPFLLPKLSHDFSVSGFVNEHRWPGIGQRFWGHFPTRLLKPLVPGRIRHRESSRR